MAVEDVEFSSSQQSYEAGDIPWEELVRRERVQLDSERGHPIPIDSAAMQRGHLVRKTRTVSACREVHHNFLRAPQMEAVDDV